MHDFEYDVMQKRRIANQARYRKNGSKSKKCSLGIDYMTKKQWKERCGNVVSYNYNHPIDWKTFRSLPLNVQTEYLEYLTNTYRVTAVEIAEMFGVVPVYLRKVCDKDLGFRFQRGRKVSEKQRRAFQMYCAGTDTCAETNEDLPQDSDSKAAEPSDSAQAQTIARSTENAYTSVMRPEPVLPQEEKRQPMNMSEFSFRFSGGFSRDMIANTLSMVLQEGSNVQIDIRCVAGESAG